jgi:DNA repair protein RadD
MSTLRDYQVRDIERIESSLARCGRVLYVLPTGAGKTVVASAIIERAVEAGKRVIVLIHRREIMRQTSLKMPVEHGIIQSGLTLDLVYPVQIASIQTLSTRLRAGKISLPAADLIVVDEAHHIAAQTWRKTVEAIVEACPHARVLGLTATPCRGDGRGLGNHFDVIVEGPQIPELIELKHLVPTIYFAPSVPDLKGVKTSAGDYQINQLSDRMNRDDLVGDIVTQWHRHGQRRKTLVFCVDVAHSIHVRDEFIKAGVRAEHLDGGTPKPDRDAILARLESGETEVVTNVMVLTEGYDCPAISCITLARPTKQMGLFRQMAGRGLRPAPGKRDLILLDHSGAVFRHGLLEDRIDWTLRTDKRAQNPKHEKRSREATSRLLECSQCAAIRTGGEPCPSCGFLPKRGGDAIVFRDGDLTRVGGSKLLQASPREKLNWFSMLLWIAGRRGYKAGWAKHKYREKFNEWPADRNGEGKPVQPYPPTPEVLSWVRSRQIAYAKRKQKEREAA